MYTVYTTVNEIIDTYIHTHIHTHIYTYIHTQKEFNVVIGGHKDKDPRRFRRGENTWSATTPSDPRASATTTTGSVDPSNSVEDNSPSLIQLNVRSALDIDIEKLPSKPWRTPDANISDYFNYGMDEASWLEYRKEQLKLREKTVSDGGSTDMTNQTQMFQQQQQQMMTTPQQRQQQLLMMQRQQQQMLLMQQQQRQRQMMMMMMQQQRGRGGGGFR